MKVLVLAAILTTATLARDARAEDDKSGHLYSWAVLRDGKAVGQESVRIVEAASGNFFASGEVQLKSGKKVHRKSHLQRDASGRLVKYQRVEAGLKGAGLRIFEWKEQMRVAPINTSGKPSDVGELPSARIWDVDMWHLLHLWGLPKSCGNAKLAYYDPGKQAAGEAALSCQGSRKVVDDKKKTIEVNVFKVAGVPAEDLQVWVDDKGQLVGAEGGGRSMLRAKWALEGGKEVAPSDADGEDSGKDAIKERGVGE